EVARDQARALMDQLVKRMLAVGAGFAPVDRASWAVDALTRQRDVLAVRFHRQLLQVGRKALEVLRVRQHSDSLCTEEIVVPDGQQAEQQRQVSLGGCVPEMLVHGVE